MEPRHTISEVAARTGFTSSALRYYENAGLITPKRSSAGYRVYDERSIERLRFISRAKQLGLSLDEITELVQLWDGDRCAPVADRLRDLIDEKIVATQRRVAELVAFAGELQRFRTALSASEIPAGPCGDSCACHAPSDSPTHVDLVRKPRAVAEAPPVACTLDPTDVTTRMSDWQELLAEAHSRTTAADGGVTAYFPPDPTLAGRIAALAAAEQSCCSFLVFAVRIEHSGTTLEVTAPPDAAPLVDALFGIPA